MTSELVRVFAFLSALATPLAAADYRAIGYAQNGSRIQAAFVDGRFIGSPTVVLLGGVDGTAESSAVVRREVQEYDAQRPARRRFHLIAIPSVNPENSALQFPPTGVAYRDHAESHVLWRWIALQAPDLILIAGERDAGLADAFTHGITGAIPARRVGLNAGILKSLPRDLARSPAHLEIERRRARTPREFTDQLTQVYGQELDQMSYIPAVALIARLRLGHRTEVERIVTPWLKGSKDSLLRPSDATMAAHLLFAALASETKDARYTAMVQKVADLGFDPNGTMRAAMPLHNEMSDSLFMDIPIVTEAGRLTGEAKYFDLAERHLEFMRKLVLRFDGLYRHSPLTEAAWGRGNAFPALGLAFALTNVPKAHPAYDIIRLAFQHHIATLARFQDDDGLWHEIIDDPASYAETSATAMIGIAILRGISLGLLDARAYRPRVDKAWAAVLARTGADGVLIDVCESTGKQPTREDYLRRTAILDRDPRGGAMALFFATEMLSKDGE